jgi:hypothetical protein
MDYPPRPALGGRAPFGYYILPHNNRVALPDPKALDALHYSFQMRAKYKTSLADCVTWLMRATGYRITISGYDHIYQKWQKKLKKEKLIEIQAKAQEIFEAKVKELKEKFGPGVIVDDGRDIAALAYKEALKAWKTKKTAK